MFQAISTALRWLGCDHLIAGRVTAPTTMSKGQRLNHHCPKCGPMQMWLYDKAEDKCYNCGWGIG